MRSFPGRFLLAMVAVSTVAVSSAAAQSKPVEFRLGLAGISFDPTSVSLGFPGAVAVGFFLNDRVALEPSVFGSFEEDDTNIGVGASLPFYLSGDHGKKGLFVAPAVSVVKFQDNDADFNIGAAAGIKFPVGTSGVGGRLAAEINDIENINVGVSFGITYHWSRK